MDTILAYYETHKFACDMSNNTPFKDHIVITKISIDEFIIIMNTIINNKYLEGNGKYDKYFMLLFCKYIEKVDPDSKTNLLPEFIKSFKKVDNPLIIKLCFIIILELLQKNINNDITVLNEILKYNYIGFSKKIFEYPIFIEKLRVLHVLECTHDGSFFDKICNYNFYQYINKGYIPNIDTLLSIIPTLFQHNTQDIPIYEHDLLKNTIKDLIQVWSIEPTKEVLDKAMLLQDLEIIKIIVTYKIEPDIITFKKLIEYNDILIASNCYPKLWFTEYKKSFAKIIDLIIDFIPLTFEMLIDVFPIYQVNDLERFNISYDERLLNMCHYYCIYPEPYMQKLSTFKTKIDLTNLFRIAKYSAIVEHCSKNNISFNMIDKYCYDNAILHHNYELLNNFSYYEQKFRPIITKYSILGNDTIKASRTLKTTKAMVIDNNVSIKNPILLKLIFKRNSMSHKNIILYYNTSKNYLRPIELEGIRGKLGPRGPCRCPMCFSHRQWNTSFIKPIRYSRIYEGVEYKEWPINYKKYNKLIYYKNCIKKMLE